MNTTDQTPVPGSSSQSRVLVAISLVLFAAFLVIVGFFGAGRVYVVETNVSYAEMERGDVAGEFTWVETTSGVSSDPTDGAGDIEWKPTGNESSWTMVSQLPGNMPAASRPDDAVFSWNRTIGIWLAAILTLCIMSFLIGDNPLYKTAEALVIGASAGYWMVYSFYTGIVDKLLVNIWPSLVRDWTTPGLSEDYQWSWIYWIPAVLSVMLICRLLPKGGWIARWPLAFVIGATAGFRLLAHLESDFLLQIKGTINPLWAIDLAGEFQLWESVSAIVILLSVLACLVYFFFSLEHTGVVGKTARGGILVLMVTFGAAFGLTVMGRITLLTERFDFLFKDWLYWL